MEHTKGKLKVFNGTDIFTDTHPLGHGDIQICDCNIHKKILDTDVELSYIEAEANARRLVACWNSHDMLLDACKAIQFARVAYQQEGKDFNESELNDMLDKAIAEAEK